jgi:hypothetical protein
MPDESVASEAAEIVSDKWSPLLLIGLVSAEFAALLGLLIWMS